MLLHGNSIASKVMPCHSLSVCLVAIPDTTNLPVSVDINLVDDFIDLCLAELLAH